MEGLNFGANTDNGEGGIKNNCTEGKIQKEEKKGWQKNAVKRLKNALFWVILSKKIHNIIHFSPTAKYPD